MDCRIFQLQHAAFLDDTLADADMVAMQCHLAECRVCARHDTTVRRALLVFRNVPCIEPSADFHLRLYRRLRDSRMRLERATVVRGPALGTFSAAAAALLVAAALAFTAAAWQHAPHDVRMSPVLALAPLEERSPITDPVMVAWASSGVPMLPVLYIAEQAPMAIAAANWQR